MSGTLSGAQPATFSGAARLATAPGYTMSGDVTSSGTKSTYSRDQSGRITGLFTMITSTTISRSIWKDGKPLGKTELYDKATGRKTTFEREGNQQIGPSVVEYEDGTKVTYPCDNEGKKTGKGSVDYPEGTHQEVTFEDGLPIGESVMSNDRATITFTYKKGGQAVSHGEIRFKVDGKEDRTRSGAYLACPIDERFKYADDFYRFRVNKSLQSESAQRR